MLASGLAPEGSFMHHVCVMFFNDFESRDSLLNPGSLQPVEIHIHTMMTISVIQS